jgi:hypothetical protein
MLDLPVGQKAFLSNLGQRREDRGEYFSERAIKPSIVLSASGQSPFKRKTVAAKIEQT